MPMPIETFTRLIQPNSVRAAKADDGQGSERQQQALKNACRDFESLFVNYLLKQMRRTVPQDGLFGGGQAEKIYTSMMDSEVAKEISRQRGLGLAPMMYHQMMAAINETTTKK
jgi:flagellar protein FlgJ